MKEAPDETPAGYEPDFVFGGQRVISEANWSEYEAQGVINLTQAIPDGDEDALRDELKRRGHDYGVENLLLGDAFDTEAGRPLQHKPGIGVYATAAGVEQRRGSSQPVLKLPDGRQIVARPGIQVKMRQPEPPTSHRG